MTTPTTSELVEIILAEFDRRNIPAYLHNLALTGSAYIKFKDSYSFIGSIRIADHEGRPKYAYKYNLRIDIVEYKEEFDRGVLRRYYPLKDLDKLIADIQLKKSCMSKDYSYLLKGPILCQV